MCRSKVSQYFFIFSMMLGFSASITISSAYKSIYSYKNVTIFSWRWFFCKCSMSFNHLHFCDMNDFRSCRYMENRRGDRFSPCRTPMLRVKKSDCFSVVKATLDLAFSYMCFIISNNFPEIPEASIFEHSVDLFKVSNAFFIIDETTVQSLTLTEIQIS